MKKKSIILGISAGIAVLVIVLIGLLIVLPKFNMDRYVEKNRYSEDRKGISFEGAIMGPVSADYANKKELRRGIVTNAEQGIPAVRKLIKRAELNLEVKNSEEAAKKIVELVNSVSGIIIDSELHKYANEAKSGRTVLKVLPKDFDAVLDSLKKLGKLDLQRVTGEDVTEEYVDLQARLNNLGVVRMRLLKILDERAREVKDILEVERELNRVGEDMERIEGRMKYLDRQADLATITVNYYEAQAIAPEGLHLWKRFKETVRKSVETFIEVFNGCIVFISALLPIVIWLFIIVFIVLVIRKIFIRR